MIYRKPYYLASKNLCGIYEIRDPPHIFIGENITLFTNQPHIYPGFEAKLRHYLYRPHFVIAMPIRGKEEIFISSFGGKPLRHHLPHVNVLVDPYTRLLRDGICWSRTGFISAMNNLSTEVRAF